MNFGLLLILGGLLLFAGSEPGWLAKLPTPGASPRNTLSELADPASALHSTVRWGAKGLFAAGLALLALSKKGRKDPGRSATAERHASSSALRTSRGLTPQVQAASAERRGDYRQAALAFDGLGDWASAARCYGQAARLAPAGSPSRTSLLQLCTQRSFSAGTVAEAIDLLLSLGEPRAAAELRGKLGDVVGQAELLVQVGAFREAAVLFEKANNLQAAASVYLKAGDHDRAVQLFRQDGDLHGAAERLAEGGAFLEAGEIWLEVGDQEGAAAAFQRSGDPLALPRALERSGNGFEAARAYLQAGRAEEALLAIGTLTPELQQSVAVRLVAAAAQLKLARPADAATTLRPLVARTGSAPRLRCDTLYLLGIAYQQAGDPTQSLTCFEQLVQIDSGFRDAALRLTQLRALPSQTQASSLPVSPWLAAHGTTSGFPSRYRIEAKIGEGAMGVVYRARDTVLDRPVALKVLGAGLADNEQARAYFLREARAAAALSHPHIVTVFDAGIEGNAPYLVMELLQGVDLETLATRPPGGLPEAQALRYAAQVADALASVHSRLIVHRDVKPSNVLRIDNTETVKLMDFGIAHLTSLVPEGQRRKATAVAGTPDYMAPEQMLGQGLGPWTDIYALGGTLYELLTGEVPFPERSGTEHGDERSPPDVRQLRPQVRLATAALVQSCLARDPRARPQSAGQLSQSLLELAAG